MGEVRIYPAQDDIIYIERVMFANLVCLIPHGKVSTSEAILDMWAKRHGKELCLISPGGLLPISRKLFFKSHDVARIDFIAEIDSRPVDDPDDLIPYYRLISPRGYLVDFATYSSKEYAAEKLAQEGHTIINSRDGCRSYKLKDYKDVLFDWDRVIINE